MTEINNDPSMARRTQLRAMLMIALVITLPICFSDSVAATNAVSIDRIYGELDGKGYSSYGYRRVIDRTVIDFRVYMDGESSIGTNQVEISTSGGVVYGRGVNVECGATSGNTAQCSFKSILGPVEWNERTYVINLFDDSGAAVSGTDQAIAYVDKQRPQIANFQYAVVTDPARSVNFSYEVKDYAGTTTYDGHCSGIRTIDLHETDLTSAPKQSMSADPTQCSVADHAIYSFAAPGLYRMCLRAIDNFGQESQGVCKDIDFMPPEFGTPVAYGPDAEELKLAGKASVRAEITVPYTGDDFDTSSAVANLESLNPAAKSVAGSCAGGVCTFSVDVKLSAGSASQIGISAKDTAGNIVSRTQYALQTTITYDGDGPIVSSLSTDKGKIGTRHIVGKNTNFTAPISENAENLEANNVFLDLSNIGGSSKLAATACDASNRCWWEVVSSGADRNGTVSVRKDTHDNLGNEMIENFTIDVIMDTNPPKNITGFNVSVLTQFEDHPGFILPGDLLEIRIDMNESTEMATAIDLSSVITSPSPAQGGCIQSIDMPGIYNCSWRTIAIDVSTPGRAALSFNFTDRAGNTNAMRYELVKTARLDQENPDNWEAPVTVCSPNWVELELSGIVEIQRVSCSIPLKPRGSGEVDTVSLRLDQCVGTLDNPNAVNYIVPEGINLRNTAPGSRLPYFMLKFREIPTDSNNISLVCPLYIISRTDEGIFHNPEIENVTIHIDVSDRVGNMAKKLNKKIDEINKRANEDWAWIGKLTKYINMGIAICNMFKAWSEANSILGTASAGLATAAKTFKALEGPSSLLDKAVTKSKSGYDNIVKNNKYVTGVCNFVTCDEGWWPWQDWYKNYVNSAKGDLMKWAGERGGPRSKAFWQDQVQNTEWPTDVKKSLILSVCTLCIPGVLLKMQEYRQMYCAYGVCLLNSGGSDISKDVCLDSFHYMTCKSIVGEIFAFFPWANFISAFVKEMQSMLSNPVSLLFGLADWIINCQLVQNKIGRGMCVFYQGTKEVFESVLKMKNYYDSFGNAFEPSTDYCETLARSVKQ